jgi:hypothetical protein
MTAKEKAEAKEKADKLVETYGIWCWKEGICDYHLAKLLALIAVNEIINSNPHSNPLNTEVYSTMEWWQEVKLKIQKK